MRWIVRGALWFGFYLLLILLPLVVAAVSPGSGAHRPFLVQFASACGYVGLAIMAFEYVLISKVTSVSAAFGQDALLQFHKQMGIFALILIVLHPAVLMLHGYPFSWLNAFSPTVPTEVRLGVGSFFGLLLLMFLALGRKTVGIPYEWWQLTHGLLTDVIVLLALAHILLINVFAGQPAMRALLGLYYLLLLAIGLRFKVVKPLLQWRKPWEVVENRQELGQSRTIVLRPVGHDGFVFEPGQFCWLNSGKTPFHKDRHPISISSCAYDEPGKDLAFTIRDLGDWSGQVVPRIRRGQRLWVDGPYGVFTADREQGPGYVLIGGGVGITPLYSMCQTFIERGDIRPVLLFLAGRDENSLTFSGELVEMQNAHPNIQVVLVVENPSPKWTGESGYVTGDLLSRYLPKRQFKRYQYFVCGPTPLMDAMERTLSAWPTHGSGDLRPRSSYGSEVRLHRLSSRLKARETFHR